MRTALDYIDPRRRIWIALALSVLVHLATLWKLPQVQLSRSDELGEQSGPLIVQLIPPHPLSPPPAARAQPRVEPRAPPPQRPAPPPPSPPRKSVERPRAPPPPPVIARKEPAPSAPVIEPRAPPVTPAPTPAPAAPSASAPTDLAAYVEARRRSRGEAAPPSETAAQSEPAPPSKGEDENARANRIAAANLGLDRKPTFGPDPRRGGGIFQITRMSYDYAEFLFYGWNRDIRRDTIQTIDVRLGNEKDIRTAVLRRMIAIIRDHEKGDFVWESQRLGRNVTLSARPRDQAGLEAFLWQEFFEDPRRPAQRP
jgi:hypothetical protein